MNEKKNCIHCHRSIDAVARVCPYCNRDQERPRSSEVRPSVPLPPIEPVAPVRVAARKRMPNWSTRALLIAAVVALLMASFAVGGLVYGLGKRGEMTRGRSDRAPQITDASPRADREFPQLTLVTDSDPTATIGRSITSAPVPDPDHKIPEEFQRSDATALSSAEYTKLLEQSRREAAKVPPPQPEQPVSVDPRTVTAQQPPAAAPPPPVERTEPEREASASRQEPLRDPFPEPRRARVERTSPVPIYQPLPRIKDRAEEIQESGTLRFRLNVDADGRVKEIRVLETMPGMTGKMIAAIQTWKFKPATENGVPVEGTFMVDISFNAPQ
jgi:TonB family protein